MANTSKFTSTTRQHLLETAKLGASRRTCARVAGISEGTLRRWLETGENASAGSRYRQFYEDFTQAEAIPNVRALRIVGREMDDRPDLAWKWLERREQGFAPPQPGISAVPQGPVVIQFSFSESVPALRASTVIDVDEQHSATDPA